jgi:hypothetical protein
MEQFWEQTAQRWRRREPTVGLANLHYNGTVEVEEEKGENEGESLGEKSGEIL